PLPPTDPPRPIRTQEPVDWVELRTPEGIPYYHNRKTNEVTWDKPDILKTGDELDKAVSVSVSVSFCFFLFLSFSFCFFLFLSVSFCLRNTKKAYASMLYLCLCSASFFSSLSLFSS